MVVVTTTVSVHIFLCNLVHFVCLYLALFFPLFFLMSSLMDPNIKYIFIAC